MAGRIFEGGKEEGEGGREEGEEGWVTIVLATLPLPLRRRPFLPPSLPLLLSITWLGPAFRFCTNHQATAAAAATTTTTTTTT